MMLSRRTFTFAALALPSASWAGGESARQPQPGDLAFRLGLPGDWITRAIVAYSPLSQARWTHVGVVVSSGANPLIVHAMPDLGVHVESWSDFASPRQAAATALLSMQDARLARRFALAAASHLGKRFDHRLAWSDDDRMYCTELAVKSLAAVGVELEVPKIRVPFYREPVLHPDSLFEYLVASGLWA